MTGLGAPQVIPSREDGEESGRWARFPRPDSSRTAALGMTGLGLVPPPGFLAHCGARNDRRSACYKRAVAARRGNDFEKAFKELETIVQRLEAEELPLDESLRLFEQGISLSRFCHQRLEEVEKKIELILADAKGQPRTEPFEMDEEESDGSGGEDLES